MNDYSCIVQKQKLPYILSVGLESVLGKTIYHLNLYECNSFIVIYLSSGSFFIFLMFFFQLFLWCVFISFCCFCSTRVCVCVFLFFCVFVYFLAFFLILSCVGFQPFLWCVLRFACSFCGVSVVLVILSSYLFLLSLYIYKIEQNFFLLCTGMCTNKFLLNY